MQKPPSASGKHWGVFSSELEAEVVGLGLGLAVNSGLCTSSECIVGCLNSFIDCDGVLVSYFVGLARAHLSQQVKLFQGGIGSPPRDPLEFRALGSVVAHCDVTSFRY
jgi:hypothetical protein